MAIPLPGTPVRGSKTGKPIMALLDLLGRTWSLGIIWNLARQSYTFREMQGVCENISPTLLNTRLKELRQALIVEKTMAGYALTELGQELLQLIYPMGDWARDWQKALKAGEVNHEQ
ncbi:transcriptional regulator [Thalassotalea insulae]|uniref:Transcriptional regulator n=1 Tax=Thalassotalea insulae TaxID=2056778 RepID=A0ABQ6GVX0_9GAMM|nr:helix-turn-helix domain-containing protein [Thalassotalea insulae]GLX80007.1 transcriptional regulator [Thalassotalea insulae]